MPNEIAELLEQLRSEHELEETDSPPQKKREVHINAPAGMTDAEAIAHAVVSTPLQSGMTVRHYLDDGCETESKELTAEVEKQVAAVNANDLRQVVRVLVSQAISLDAIYSQYARQSAMNRYHEEKERYLKMALAAQRHCVKTIEALAALKNPPKVAFGSIPTKVRKLS